VRRLACLAILMALTSDVIVGQQPPDAPAATTPTPPPDPAARAWEFSASVSGYFANGGHYAQPTFTADRGRLHLEARYNYEAVETGSVWVGCNFSGGEALSWELTPMLGGVFGTTAGIAPGYKGSLSGWKLELYSEGEYVFDAGNSGDSFFYNWSEFTLTPVDRVRFGLVTQRTRAYQAERDIQRGVLAGVTFEQVSVTGYLLDPDKSHPTFVLTVALTF
jgi:hypothetical protein